MQQQQPTSPEMTALFAEIIRLKAENLTLAAGKPQGSIKVSTKGAVSIYGLGRFPVTLYSSQWQALFNKQDAIKAFIESSASLLAVK